MDINKMLAELRSEQDQIEEAILVLERLARGRENSAGDHLLGCLRSRDVAVHRAARTSRSKRRGDGRAQSPRKSFDQCWTYPGWIKDTALFADCSVQ
jgi:hypothetical protein